ncbi:RNA-directed DNA polymerase from mobile element jockey-like protein [Willisornis vidua]|uniref:RNA-directed DNA polymerase from mobile element jockey-like protein n=1 Tax=Willisornis vidua TaxID=1566151 RepID=A0ABQ9DMW0_9PASS|nr:RNA-directed DNA polymerase from mobile element jockey-like protein [Willisornis vidua]
MITSQAGTDKAEVFNAFFALVFNTNDRPRESHCPELEDHYCEKDQLPVNPEFVQDLLLQLDPYKCMGSDGIHLRILKGLVDVVAKCPLMILECSWESEEVSVDWKLMDIVPVFKKGKENPGNYRPISLNSVPSKVME